LFHQLELLPNFTIALEGYKILLQKACVRDWLDGVASDVHAPGVCRFLDA
jgi:hypothetical protein